MTTNPGSFGVWTGVLDQQPAAKAQDLAAELEAMGWGAIWFPEVIGRDALVNAALLLTGTEKIVLATGIANIYARDAMAMRAGWNTLSEAFPGRFILGLGVSHQPAVEGFRGHEYKPPLTMMRSYLEQMDAALYFAAQPTEPPLRVLAALGPKMLELARDKTQGAHPYLATPEHTEIARTILGDDPLLAPEQMVVIETDPSDAREQARQALAIYLPGLPNYANNLRRLGFSEEDLTAPLSDHLVDSIVAWGDIDTVVARVQAHKDAGADHVCVQVLGGDVDALMRDYQLLAAALL
jgi:probable F420-dependent oxidoreductase